MPHTFASLLMHVVFSTKNRAPDLPAELTGRFLPRRSRTGRRGLSLKRQVDQSQQVFGLRILG
jgi:hypothetical protein